jgi:nucleotide-binding universal stress UspA family protein
LKTTASIFQHLHLKQAMETKSLDETNPTVIICGTDFTPATSHAADTASALARRMNCTLDLVHTSALPSDLPTHERLSAEADRLRQLGADVHEFIVEGSAGEELVKLADPKSCRMVVVSSLGKRAPQRWLLGSVSERTSERALVPTLVVRDAAPFLEWTRGERPLHVFVAFNFTETSEAALRWVKGLLLLGPCVVVVGYAAHPPEERARLGGAGPLAMVGNPPEVQAILERDLTARVTELLGTTDFQICVEANWGRPDAALDSMAVRAGADVVVIGSHQYQGFERIWNTSVSSWLLRSTTSNVVVVPLATMRTKPVLIVPVVERVLVATDFSALANRAIPHAYSLLRAGGVVHLVHVTQPQALSDSDYLKGEVMEQFKTRQTKHSKICQKKLEELVPADAASCGILTEVAVVEQSDAALGIRQAAERFGVDAICLATHGHTGLVSVVLGSVAMSLLGQSTRPIYLIRAIGN